MMFHGNEVRGRTSAVSDARPVISRRSLVDAIFAMGLVLSVTIALVLALALGGRTKGSP
jgi:hypothetical protein